MVMGFAATNGKERFELPGASSSTVVWNITSSKLPMKITTYPYDDESGSGLAFYSSAASNSTYVAFDPSKTLKKISGFEPVANQNLHAMQVPDFLIITTDAFLEQANRLADLHRAVDGIDVAVVTQDQVFNEFRICCSLAGAPMTTGSCSAAILICCLLIRVITAMNWASATRVTISSVFWRIIRVLT